MQEKHFVILTHRHFLVEAFCNLLRDFPVKIEHWTEMMNLAPKNIAIDWEMVEQNQGLLEASFTANNIFIISSKQIELVRLGGITEFVSIVCLKEKAPTNNWKALLLAQLYPIEIFREKASGLSAREKQAARLAAKGCTNRAIAEEMEIATGTVKVLLRKVFEKLGINSRGQLRQFFE